MVWRQSLHVHGTMLSPADPWMEKEGRGKAIAQTYTSAPAQTNWSDTEIGACGTAPAKNCATLVFPAGWGMCERDCALSSTIPLQALSLAMHISITTSAKFLWPKDFKSSMAKFSAGLLPLTLMEWTQQKVWTLIVKLGLFPDYLNPVQCKLHGKEEASNNIKHSS